LREVICCATIAAEVRIVRRYLPVVLQAAIHAGYKVFKVWLGIRATKTTFHVHWQIATRADANEFAWLVIRPFAAAILAFGSAITPSAIHGYTAAKGVEMFVLYMAWMMNAFYLKKTVAGSRLQKQMNPFGPACVTDFVSFRREFTVVVLVQEIH
jgi:hypothetical protein